jgi:hypothetical protein
MGAVGSVAQAAKRASAMATKRDLQSVMIDGMLRRVVVAAFEGWRCDVTP